MNRHAIGAAVLTVAAAGLLLIQAVSWPQSARFGLPAATTLACGIRADTVDPRAKAAGLQIGDVIAFSKMSREARVASAFHYTATQAGRAGETIQLAVQRGSAQLRIPYVLQHTDSELIFVSQLAFKLTLFAIAMLLLWRGSGKAALMLALWCLSVGTGLPDAWWGPLPLDLRIAGGALTSFLWTFSPYLLYLVVESVATGVSGLAKTIARGAMIVMIVPELLLNTANSTAQAIGGCNVVSVPPWLSNAAFVGAQLVIIAFFILSYLHTTGIAKQRIRWVFWAFLLSRVGVLLNLFNRLAVHPVHLSGFEWATVLIFPLGCAYAILRHRLIDVNFVLNRTLIYTMLTTLVVGIFILIEYLLHLAAASRGVGIAVDVIVALILGFSFNTLHKRIETSIERVLFRSKHQAALALQLLCEEAAFMESADALLARAVSEIPEAIRGPGAAVYERIEDAYVLTASSGVRSFAGRVDVDDLAFVRLRKLRTQVDLSEIPGALNMDGIAFAFSSRGQLSGALVCRRRSNGEAYAPDELELMRSVAHEIGAELYAIRARRQSELLEELLAGSIDLSDARERFAAAGIRVAAR